MKVIFFNGRSRLHFKKTSIAIGIFDGMHRGHRFLIKKMLASAKRLGALPLVMTFFPHPAHVLKPALKMPYLSCLEDRLDWLDSLGVRVCVVVRFNRAFAHMQPETFIEKILVKQCGAKAIFVGKYFRFGRERRGDILLFKQLAAVLGYEVHAVPALKEKLKVISSTRIRQLMGKGKLDRAADLLGRRVSVSGRVVKGSARGKVLGFPTANIDYESPGVPFLLPPQGVYIVRVFLKGKIYPAVANIGTRPSFEKEDAKPHLEAYIFNFFKNIYGQYVKVEFIKKIRNEKKFSSPQKLIQQIQQDVKQARQYFRLG